MHVFWEAGELTATEIRDSLAGQGRDLAYTTVATLIRILFEKGFLIQMNEQRPFRFKPARPAEDVSKSMIGDMVDHAEWAGCWLQQKMPVIGHQLIAQDTSWPFP